MPRLGEIRAHYRSAEDAAELEVFDLDDVSVSLARVEVTQTDTKVTVGRVVLMVGKNDWLIAVDGKAKTGGVIGD